MRGYMCGYMCGGGTVRKLEGLFGDVHVEL